MGKVFIVVSEDESRALYYSYDLGRRRIYRSTYPKPMWNTFRLFYYKRKKKAQELIRTTFEAYGDKFKILEVEEEFAKNVRVKK